MIVREATSNDIPGILGVLKASLGEVSSKKTEEIWRFKHLDNPFGESLVLLADVDGEIIGVRAFMRWNWQRGKDVFSAYRAVDTATHPDHRGKGIFKKLTLKAVEMGKSQEDHFVFNTPNDQSLPGYLKMGWKEVSKVKISLMPISPQFWNRKTENYKYADNFDSGIISETLTNYNKKLIANGKLYTPKSGSFLEWRYVNNPLQSYRVLGSDKIFIAAYVKEHKYLRELRVAEMIYSNDSDRQGLKKIIAAWAKESGVHFVSYHSPTEERISRFELGGRFGPVLTFKNLNTADENFLNLNSWAYSLGDLELF